MLELLFKKHSERHFYPLNFEDNFVFSSLKAKQKQASGVLKNALELGAQLIPMLCEFVWPGHQAAGNTLNLSTSLRLLPNILQSGGSSDSYRQKEQQKSRSWALL